MKFIIDDMVILLYCYMYNCILINILIYNMDIDIFYRFVFICNCEGSFEKCKILIFVK